MNVEYHKYWSTCLEQDMEFKVYGHAGKPVLVFPSMAGRFYDFEDYGMIEAVSSFIDAGQFQFFTVDSVDRQSWANWNLPPAQRALRHEDYDHYIVQEIVPFIRQRVGAETQLLTTGVSMGGYHSANFFFRHPDLFDCLVSMSGIFQLSMFIGDYMDDNVYFNSPLLYMPNLEDPWYLEKYRRSQIIICFGPGRLGRSHAHRHPLLLPGARAQANPRHGRPVGRRRRPRLALVAQTAFLFPWQARRNQFPPLSCLKKVLNQTLSQPVRVATGSGSKIFLPIRVHLWQKFFVFAAKLTRQS